MNVQRLIGIIILLLWTILVVGYLITKIGFAATMGVFILPVVISLTFVLGLWLVLKGDDDG